MRISIESTLLADPNPAIGKEGPSGLTLNGEQIVDEAQFFRAIAPRYYARGGAGVVLQFSVTRSFSTLASAQAFALQHPNAIPTEGLLAVVCGVGDDDEQSVYLEDSVLQSVQIAEVRGVSVRVQYVFRGPKFTSDVPLEGDPAEELEDEAMTRRGKVALTMGDTSKAFTFATAMDAVPIVNVTLSRATGGDLVFVMLNEDSLTINGGTAEFSAPIPSAGWYLNYVARS